VWQDLNSFRGTIKVFGLTEKPTNNSDAQSTTRILESQVSWRRQNCSSGSDEAVEIMAERDEVISELATLRDAEKATERAMQSHRDNVKTVGVRGSFERRKDVTCSELERLSTAMEKAQAVENTQDILNIHMNRSKGSLSNSEKPNSPERTLCYQSPGKCVPVLAGRTAETSQVRNDTQLGW